MDSFLFIGDYARSIQADNLQQIIGNSPIRLEEATRAAMSEISDLLKGKFDVNSELQPTPQHDKTKSYKAGQTVYLNAPDYMANKAYSIGDLFAYQSNIYKVTTAISKEPFNPNHSTLIGAQYATYYALTTKPLFDYKNFYTKGDIVFYKDKIYTCQINTQVLDHQAQLNLGITTNTLINIFPDDKAKGVQYWGIGVDYLVLANTEITDTDYWSEGDARDQKLLQVCIDVALYRLHSRISPRNIPELRVKNYMGEAEDRISTKSKIIYPMYCALGWCQNVREGDDITPSMQKIQPDSGQRILSSSNVKNNNFY